MVNKEMKTLTFGDTTYEIVDDEARQKINEVEKSIGDMETALDEIIAVQNKLIGGDES